MFDRRQCKAVAKDLMRANRGPSVVPGILYAAPYVHQTEAVVYNTMKYNSIRESRVSAADFEPTAPFADDQAR